MATTEVVYTRKGTVNTIETNNAALGTIVFDTSKLDEGQKSGTAKQLLGASVLSCYVSALATALDARDAKVSDITAKALIEVGGNDLGQGRVKKITIETKVSLPEGDAEIFERCQKIMRQGCLVTSSVHEGIAIDYDLQPVYKD